MVHTYHFIYIDHDPMDVSMAYCKNNRWQGNVYIVVGYLAEIVDSNNGSFASNINNWLWRAVFILVWRLDFYLLFMIEGSPAVAIF